MKNIDYEKFERLIEKHDLYNKWGDGLFVTTDKERMERIDKKFSEAKKAYEIMMKSPKNNGTNRYQQWALERALGITPNKARCQLPLYQK